MKADNEILVEQEARLEAWTDEFRQVLLELIQLRAEPYSTVVQKRLKVLEVHSRAIKLFNESERFCETSSILGAHKDDTWLIGCAERCANVLDSITNYYETLYGIAEAYEMPREQFRPAAAAYASMQRLVKSFCPDRMKELGQRFGDLGLPTRGFDRGGIRRLSPWEKGLAFSFVVAFAVVLIVLVSFIPNPTKSQFTVCRFIMSLVAGAAGTMLSGAIQVEGSWKGIGVRAGGAMAAFVLVYCTMPALQ